MLTLSQWTKTSWLCSHIVQVQWHCTHYFDLCAVGQLLDGVAVLCVELEQDGHLEGGGLQGHDT